MIDNIQLKTILSETLLPVAYGSFQTPQEAPFVLFQFAYTDNSFADDKVLEVRNRWNVNLYTKIKDIATEAKIEETLGKYFLVWDKNETYDNSEKLYQITYEIKEI